MWGPEGLGFDPEAALVAKSWKNTLFTQIELPKSHYLSRSAHQRPPSPVPGAPGPSGMLIKPICGPRGLGFDPKATRKNSPGNGEMPCFALLSTGAEKSKIIISDTKGGRECS